MRTTRDCPIKIACQMLYVKRSSPEPLIAGRLFASMDGAVSAVAWPEKLDKLQRIYACHSEVE